MRHYYFCDVNGFRISENSHSIGATIFSIAKRALFRTKKKKENLCSRVQIICCVPFFSERYLLEYQMNRSGAGYDGRGSRGYDCNFVECPSELLQIKCPVCLCVLHDPYIVDCCGYSFCYICIKAIQSCQKPCPLCNEEFGTILPDKRLSRTLKAMKVYCLHSKSGCDWQGELGQIEEHLSSSDKGCAYIQVKCKDCNMWMERKKISYHQLDECPKIPYSCDYCHEYQSSREDVTVRHWPVCPSRPVSCPNECGVFPQRQHLERHLSEDCQVRAVECEFSYAGCKIALAPADMELHIAEEIGTHLTLQNRYFKNSLEKKLENCESKIAHLEKENEQLKSTIMMMQHRMDESEISLNKQNLHGVKLPIQFVVPDVADENIKNSNVVEKKLYLEELEALKSLICVVPLQFTIHSVSQLQLKQMKWISAPFYTHAQGVMMCLKIYPNGHGTSEGRDLSVYVCIMKGKYDDLQKWPFRGSVTLRLIDQKEGNDHIIRTVSFHEGVDEEYSGRVQDCDMSGGWGILKFASLDRLIPKYLQNDTLLIAVDRVRLAC